MARSPRLQSSTRSASVMVPSLARRKWMTALWIALVWTYRWPPSGSFDKFTPLGLDQGAGSGDRLATPAAAPLALAEPRSGDSDESGDRSRSVASQMRKPFCTSASRSWHQQRRSRGPHEADLGGDPQVMTVLVGFFDGLVARNLAVQPNGPIRAIMREGRLAVNPVIA